MKKFLIALLLVVLLYPAIPWLLGRTIEQRVGEYTEQIQQQLPYVSIVQTQFTRGWYSSTQDITIGGAAPVVGVPGSQVTIHNVIHHGPICGLACIGLARVETHFVFPATAQASVAKIFGKAEPVTIETRLHLLGGLTTTLASPPLSDVALDGGARVTSSGLSFTVEQGARADGLAMHGDLAQIRYRDRGATAIELDGASFESHSQRLLRSLYAGDGAFTVHKLAVDGLPQGSFSVSDLHVTTRTSAEADAKAGGAAGFVAVTVQFGTGEIATKPLTLTSTDFDFSYRHLNADALESLTAALGAVNHDAATLPAQRGEKLAAVLRDKAPALLLQDPVFTVDRLHMQDAGGALLVTGSVRLAGFAAADLGPAAEPKALLQKLQVSLDLTCDQAFLASVPNGPVLTAQLQAFVQQGLATLEHGQFHSKLAFADGKLTFNGQPPPTPATPPAPASRPPIATAPSAATNQTLVVLKRH